MFCMFYYHLYFFIFFFFSSRRRHTRSLCDWSSDVCSSDLLAAPVILSATVVFVACMVALIQPVYRRGALRVAEIGGWLIPAWLVMGAMVLGAISFALNQAD